MALVADATVAQAHAQREAVERDLTLVYSRALRKLGKWIIAHYGLPESITAADAPLTPDGLLEMLGQWDEIVGKELRPAMMKAFEKHWGWVSNNLAAGPLDSTQTQIILGPNVRDVRAAAMFDTAKPRIRDIGKSMHSELSTLLRTKYEEGSTPDDTAAAIREMVGTRMVGKRGVTPARARMIARTETAALVSGADQAAAEELENAGIKAQKEWLATKDARTRHEHDELDGKRVGVKESFTVNGYSLRYPGDPNGKAGLVINCRCTTLLRVDESEDASAEVPSLTEGEPAPPPSPSLPAPNPATVDKVYRMLEEGTHTPQQFKTALAVAEPQAQSSILAGLQRWDEHLSRQPAVFTPRKFASADDARSWAYSNWGGPERFSLEELAVVRGYTGARYGPINNSLRSGRVTKEVKTMDAAMERAARVPEDVVAVRSTSLRQFGFTAVKGFDPQSIVGKTFADKGFLSTGVGGRVTSLDKRNNVRLSINVPKGSRGVYVSGGGKGSSSQTVISESGRGENELILDRGSQLRVVSVKKRGDGWDVVADLVGQEKR